MVTEKKIEEWLKRDKPPVFERYKEKEDNKWSKFRKEVDFKYYVCDYCRGAIRIKNKYIEQDGGEFVLPLSRLMKGKVKLAVHNYCLNKLLKEIDEIIVKK